MIHRNGKKGKKAAGKTMEINSWRQKVNLFLFLHVFGLIIIDRFINTWYL